MRAFSRFLTTRRVLPAYFVAGASRLAGPHVSSCASGTCSQFSADYEADCTDKVFLLGPDNDIALLWKINGDHIELAVAAGAAKRAVWFWHRRCWCHACLELTLSPLKPPPTKTLTDRHSLKFAKPVPDLHQDDWTLVGSDSDDIFVPLGPSSRMIHRIVI
jgi:hypothetical protein